MSLRPQHIGHLCPHCGVDLAPRATVERNADDDEWVCFAACSEAVYFDWDQQHMTDVLGPGFPPWPTKGATFAELQAAIEEAPDLLAPDDLQRARDYVASLPTLPPEEGDDPPLPDFDDEDER